MGSAHPRAAPLPPDTDTRHGEGGLQRASLCPPPHLLFFFFFFLSLCSDGTLNPPLQPPEGRGLNVTLGHQSAQPPARVSLVGAV